MEATLIMLDKPILVNEETSTEFNFVLINNRHIRVVSKEECKIAKDCLEVGGFNAIQKDVCKKILAGHEGTKRLTFQLSDKDAKRIGYVDVEKLAEEYCLKYGETFFTPRERGNRKLGIIYGIETAFTLTPKKYTEEDMVQFHFWLLCNSWLYNTATNVYINNNMERLTVNDLFKAWEAKRPPKKFKVKECTETENEIIVTKIL